MITRSQAGFTFVETLMALLIFVALTAVVAAGIPAAYHTYWNVVNSSNAQLALSATTSALRNELSMAEKVIPASDGKTVDFFRTAAGYWERIEIAGKDEGYAGLVVRVYEASENSPDKNDVPIRSRALVPDATFAKARDDSNGKMSIEMGSPITYDSSMGVFTVSDLKIALDGKVLAECGEYKVRATLRPETLSAP